jgi:hypothetical protein
MQRMASLGVRRSQVLSREYSTALFPVIFFGSVTLSLKRVGFEGA